MDYNFLREEGIKHVQKLAGKIWTDYNIHDPGVTTLEILSYAITELGYRAGYPIADLLTPNPDEEQEIKNFYTARQIFPNSAVTLNDYRKLLIDVDVADGSDTDCPHAGIKNAWLSLAKESEVPFYLHKKESKLSYDPDPDYVSPKGKKDKQQPMVPGILYDILLEFDSCSKYGDLNENTLTGTLTITEHEDDTNLNGLKIKITVNFPRWDNDDVNMEDPVSIRSGVQDIKLSFVNLPDGYSFGYKRNNNLIQLTGSKTSSSDTTDIPGLTAIETKINDFIYFAEDSLLAFYLKKTDKIKQIIEKAKATLNANRNLSEDFYRFSALKVEKIAVCADIELAPESSVNEVQAKIFHVIGKFLSPTVHFYTLEEMLNKCRVLHRFDITAIDTGNRSFTVKGNTGNKLTTDENIEVQNSRSNNGSYTVKAVKVTGSQTKIFVKEDITSGLLTEGEKLTFYHTDNSNCLTADRIFEGPALEHGFIDDEELEKAGRKKHIHVSDVIRLIMDIPGVNAVRSIQLANLPQDNTDNAITSKSVKWCMDLAFEHNYIPRLSKQDSKITFYKESLPFRASAKETETLIASLEQNERPAKLFIPVQNFDVPKGTYRDLESYESIQNDFPLTYGIGEEGIPTKSTDKEANKLREAQALQFKGYLMVFDQLLANYFAQLAHVKDLFSMNAKKDANGNYIIGRTYYTRPLFDIVPDAGQLYVDKNGHAVALNNIAENEKLFFERKNRFLDHLIGRFAERFTDYALLTIKLSGEKRGNEELTEDKLEFLNRYPLISSSRSKGFNYAAGNTVWHPENISGLRQRVSFLTGIKEYAADRLTFSDKFTFNEGPSGVKVSVSDGSSALLTSAPPSFSDKTEAKKELEKMLISGCLKENYEIEDTGAGYRFVLKNNEGKTIGVSAKSSYSENIPGGDADDDINKLTGIFREEFFTNVESNRNNLSCPLMNYARYSITVNMEADPPEAIVSYKLYSNPFAFGPQDLVLSGEQKIPGNPKDEADIISVDTATGRIVTEGNIAGKLHPGDKVTIVRSAGNNGIYTVVSSSYASDKTTVYVSETILSGDTPRGELKFNTDTAAGLHLKAEEKIYDILWELINRARAEKNYHFSTVNGKYRFILTNRYAEDIAQSADGDFNNTPAEEIKNLPSGKIEVTGTGTVDGKYEVETTSANEDKVLITLKNTLPSSSSQGTLKLHEEFSYTTSLTENSFVVTAKFENILFSGSKISITGSESIDGNYTLLSVSSTGTETKLKVKETIPAADNSGKLCYEKTFQITEASGKNITVKGGCEHKAVSGFIDFIRDTFFSHEGFHVVEHILLRPKTKGVHFVEATTETLTEGLAGNGKISFNKTVPVLEADTAKRFFRVSGDIRGEIHASPEKQIYVSGSGADDGTFSVKRLLFNSNSNHTTIYVKGPVPENIPKDASYGEISYFKDTEVKEVSATEISVSVSDNEVLNIFPGESVEITGSTGKLNDKRFEVKEVTGDDTSQKIFISRVEAETEDRLLNIVLENNECDACKITDPYTCVTSIIIPHWQGRFDNMDFRRFFEKQLRMETPAHVFLNVCWISCEQMNEFEQKYKTWLLENSAKTKDEGNLSARQNELTDILNKLRNIYPTGTLHDCKKDSTLENAIILDNTVLGND